MVESKCEPIRDLCDQFDFEQLIKQPTNLTIHGETLIDVILCSNPSLCLKSGVKDTGLSDSHSMVYVVMKIKADRLPARNVTYRCYKQFNEEQYSEDISQIPLSVCEVFDDPSDNYWMLQTMLKEIMDEHAPLKTMKVRAKEPPFMNGELRRAVRVKTRLHNIYRKRPTKHNWERYRQQRNVTTNIRKNAIRDYFNHKCSGGPRNCNFWKTMKPFLTNKGAKDGSSIMIRTEDYIETNPKEVANLMNNFYVNIATEIGGKISLDQGILSNKDHISKCVTHFKDHTSIKNITECMGKSDFTFEHTDASTVEKIVKCLNTSKATGCDHIPAKLLKPVASTLSHHISTIFNQCVDTCTFPMDAKLAEVVPLYKKADNLTMQNYRPISILPSLSKVLEKIIHQQLLRFLLETILDPRMAAYRKGYSCQHVLLRVVEDWKLALDNRKHVAAMLMDLSKAFDSLPHELIIAKLKAYGMKEEGCAFVWAYLSKRKQRVKLSGRASDWMELLKGVPQGSILGPIFFNIFMNDIYATITRSSLYNYADDNTIAVSIVMKCFERIIVSHLLPLIKPILDPHQFAYRANRSVDDATLTLVHHLYQHLDTGGHHSRVLMVDFSSAFNTIQPHLMMQKMMSMALNPNIILWVQQFLTGRLQRVCLGTTRSDTIRTNTGAPQGCVISPVLFTLYTNDCVSTRDSCEIIKYADDTAILGKLSTNPVRHADYLNCITDFTDWCTANFLELNVSKTKELIFDFRRSQCPVQPVAIGTDTVEIVNEYKYLGTIIDNQLNWSSNIRQLYSKCQQRLYFLRKLNEFHIDHTIMHMFYTSVIQSIFAFCILVYYGNASSRDIHKVHRIIRQAQKLTQCQCQSIQEIYNIVCTRKVRLIVGDEAHPLHQYYSKLRSGIRFKSMRGRTKRYLTYFVPASITHFNSLCRR